MKLDIVRLPLTAAFAVLLAFAAAAMIHTEGAFNAVELLDLPASLLGDYILMFQSLYPVASKVICGIMIFFTGFYLGRITVRYALYATHTYLAITLFAILACGLFVSEFYTIQYLTAALFALSLKHYCICYRNGMYSFGAIFKASFYLGLIPLIYTPALLLIVVIPIATWALKRSFREFIVAFVGFVLPFAMLSYVNWGLGGDFITPALFLWESFITPAGLSVFDISICVWTLLGSLFLLYLLSAACFFADLYASGAKPRAILLFNFILFLVLVAMFFVPCTSVVTIAMVAIPSAVVLPLFFVRIDRTIGFFIVFSLAVYVTLLFFI